MGSLIHNEDARIFEHDTRDCDEPLFTLGNLVSVFLDYSIITIFQLPNPIVDVYRLCRCQHFLLCSTGASIQNVLADRCIEEASLWSYYTNQFVKRSLGHVFHVDTIY